MDANCEADNVANDTHALEEPDDDAHEHQDFEDPEDPHESDSSSDEEEDITTMDTNEPVIANTQESNFQQAELTKDPETETGENPSGDPIQPNAQDATDHVSFEDAPQQDEGAIEHEEDQEDEVPTGRVSTMDDHGREQSQAFSKD